MGTVGCGSPSPFRLSLAKFCGHILDLLLSGHPLINEISPRRHRPAISSLQSTQDDVGLKETISSELLSPIGKCHKSKASVVIFDKDGTLISFDEMWIPWAQIIAKCIVESTKLEITNEIYKTLNYSHELKRVLPGLLAQGTTAQIREALVRLLIAHGILLKDALNYVNAALKEAEQATVSIVKETADLKRLFEELRQNDVNIAVCTSDSRSATLSALKTLGVDRFVRIIACGDDAGAIPKPNPHNALSICRQLDIDPQEAVVVGDTLADLGMGRTARLGCTVGVLSGVCGREHLSSYADFIIPDVGKLMPIVLNMPPNDATKPSTR